MKRNHLMYYSFQSAPCSNIQLHIRYFRQPLYLHSARRAFQSAAAKEMKGCGRNHGKRNGSLLADSFVDSSPSLLSRATWQPHSVDKVWAKIVWKQINFHFYVCRQLEIARPTLGRSLRATQNGMPNKIEGARKRASSVENGRSIEKQTLWWILVE